MRRVTAIILLVIGTGLLLWSAYEMYTFIVIAMGYELFRTLGELFLPEHRLYLIYTFTPPVLGFLIGVWAYRSSSFGTWARIVWVTNLLVILAGVGVALSVTQLMR